MKKLSFVVVLLLAANFAFGQLSFGPKIGFHTSSLDTDLEGIKTDLKQSFHFGAFVRLGRKIYVQPEVNWLTRGGVFEREAKIGIEPFEQEIDMKTIEVPVLLGYRVIHFGVANVRLMAGPSASIVTKSTINTKDAAGFIEPIKEADINDLVWGFNVGGGVDVLMFTLDVRYQFGLNEIIETVDSFNFNSKSNIFAVSLGWKIL
jgi:hypothetical protein